MDFVNSRMSEQLPLIGVIQPVSLNNGALSTAWFDMSLYERVLGLCQMGVGDTTVTAKFEQATSSAGAGAKDIKTAVALSATDDGKSVQLNLRAKELDKAGGFRWARLTITNSNATGSIIAGSVRAAAVHYGPDTDQNVATLQQTIA